MADRKGVSSKQTKKLSIIFPLFLLLPLTRLHTTPIDR
jgi:hypothetical protein